MDELQVVTSVVVGYDLLRKPEEVFSCASRKADCLWIMLNQLSKLISSAIDNWALGWDFDVDLLV